MTSGRLARFLEAAAGRRYAWGRHDSMLLVADWMLEVTGRDPAAPWRGRYTTELGARRLIRAAGGKEAMLDTAFADLACAVRVDANAVRPGDVGLAPVVTPALRFEPVAAVFSGLGWVWQAAHGTLTAPAAAVAAWRPTP